MPWIFVFLGTWELPHTHHESDSSVGIFQNFGSIFKNKSFRIHIGMYVCAYAAMDILMGWLLFYLTDCIGKPGMFAILLPALVFAEVLCVPLYAMLSNKFGHAKSFMIGLSIWIAGMIFMAFQTADTPNILLILNSILIGVGLSAGALIPYNLLPYVIDVDELMTKKKRSGTYSGAMTLIRKLIQGALVLPLIGVLLTAIDYKKLNLDMITFDKTNSQILALSDSMIKKNNIDYVNSTKVKLASFSDRLVLISSKIEDANQKDIFSAKANEVSGLVSNLKDASEAEQALNLASQVSELSLSIKDSLKIKQSAETSSKMRALFVFSPIAFLILGIIFALFFKISPKAHEVLMKEIDRLKKGGKKSDVKPDVKKLCEDLTGIAYDKLY